MESPDKTSWVEWLPCGHTIPVSLMANYGTIMEIPGGRSYYCPCGGTEDQGGRVPCLVGEAILHVTGIGGWHESHTLYKAERPPPNYRRSAE